MTKKRSEIKIEVELDENHIPESITWHATDNDASKKAKAFFLSVWDEKERNTLKIDLWNKEMSVDEMKMLTHQSIITMADSFERATGETQMALAMKDFAEYFAEKMKMV